MAVVVVVAVEAASPPDKIFQTSPDSDKAVVGQVLLVPILPTEHPLQIFPVQKIGRHTTQEIPVTLLVTVAVIETVVIALIPVLMMTTMDTRPAHPVISVASLAVILGLQAEIIRDNGIFHALRLSHQPDRIIVAQTGTAHGTKRG